jgi:hypothetical protein
VYRVWKIRSIPDFTTITDKYQGKTNITDFIKKYFTESNVKQCLTNLIKDNRKENFSLTVYAANASSPSGGHSDLSTLKDFKTIWTGDDNKRECILDIIRSMPRGEIIEHLLETIALNLSIDKDFIGSKYHSKIFTFTASGGKARIIAIVDWVTQTA